MYGGDGLAGLLAGSNLRHCMIKSVGGSFGTVCTVRGMIAGLCFRCGHSPQFGKSGMRVKGQGNLLVYLEEGRPF